MFIWRLLVLLAWADYLFSIYMFYDVERIWIISLWSTALLSLAAFLFYYWRIRKTELAGKMPWKISFPLISVLPGILVYPTALLM